MTLDDAIYLVGKLTLELELLKVRQQQQEPLVQKLWQEKQDQDYNDKVKQFAQYLKELGCD